MGRLIRLACAGACLFGASCAPESGPPRPRGVLLISIDSLRADHLSSYGYRSATAPEVATSPIIDRELAGAGVAFDRAYSTTSWTLPAHMALLTGLPDELHGVRHPSQKLHASLPTLAELFRSAGWRSAGFFSGPNVHPHFGFGRGFERYVDCSTVEVADPAVFEIDQQSDQIGRLKDLQRLSHQGRTSPELVRAFETWFDTLAAGERFFGFVHMWDVHYDYAAPEDLVRLFDPGYEGQLDGENFWEFVNREERDPRDVQHLLALYDAEIRFTDEHVGLLLDALKGRLDDTLVVLVSDHGEEFFEHGRFGHDRTLFEEVVRVPILMRYPARLPGGRRLDQLASLTDVAPTILELCDLPRPRSMFGRSLVRAVEGGFAPRGVPMELTFRRLDNVLSGYHGGDFKVVRHSKSGDPVLYELATDPRELAGLRKGAGLGLEDPRLGRALGTWNLLSELGASFQRADEGALPPDLEGLLRGIGYLGAEVER